MVKQIEAAPLILLTTTSSSTRNRVKCREDDEAA